MRISENRLDSDFAKRVGLDKHIDHKEKFVIVHSVSPNVRITVTPITQIIIYDYDTNTRYMYDKFIISYSSHRAFPYRTFRANDANTNKSTLFDELDGYMSRSWNLCYSNDKARIRVAERLLCKVLSGYYPFLESALDESSLTIDGDKVLISDIKWEVIKK